MSIEYRGREYSDITENTKEWSEDKLFLKTKQNSKYIDSLPKDAVTISIQELIDIWSLKDIKIVGVSGTNGKTTTSALIYSILSDLGYKSALQGTRGLFIDDEQMELKKMTTPSILQTLRHIKMAKDKGAKYFVMEVSSHAIAQDRIEGLEFALKVHTNVTRDHLDYHGTIEEYRRVKSLFFLDESPKLLNKDEIKSLNFNPKNAMTYGVDEPATFKIMAYSLNNGINGVIEHLGEREAFFSNMMGLFNLYNITASISAVKMLTNRALCDICEAVEYFGGVSGRMEVVSKEPMVIIDFAHTPDGIYKVLDSIKDRDLIVVFGAGGDRDRGKRAKMGAVAGRFAKKIFVTSDNPRSEEPQKIIDDILEGLRGKEGVKAVIDRREAIREAIESVEGNEIVMILGKGDERYQEINGKKIPFSDREVVGEILSSMRN